MQQKIRKIRSCLEKVCGTVEKIGKGIVCILSFTNVINADGTDYAKRNVLHVRDGQALSALGWRTIGTSRLEETTLTLPEYYHYCELPTELETPTDKAACEKMCIDQLITTDKKVKKDAKALCKFKVEPVGCSFMRCNPIKEDGYEIRRTSNTELLPLKLYQPQVKKVRRFKELVLDSIPLTCFGNEKDFISQINEKLFPPVSEESRGTIPELDPENCGTPIELGRSKDSNACKNACQNALNEYGYSPNFYWCVYRKTEKVKERTCAIVSAMNDYKINYPGFKMCKITAEFGPTTKLCLYKKDDAVTPLFNHWDRTGQMDY